MLVRFIIFLCYPLIYIYSILLLYYYCIYIKFLQWDSTDSTVRHLQVRRSAVLISSHSVRLYFLFEQIKWIGLLNTAGIRVGEGDICQGAIWPFLARTQYYWKTLTYNTKHFHFWGMQLGCAKTVLPLFMEFLSEVRCNFKCRPCFIPHFCL